MKPRIRSARAISIAICAIALAGCSSETPQQKFIDAMNHGNSAQASQIWLHMDAKSREDFAHNQGLSPNVSPDDIKKQITQHYAGKMAGDNGENEEDTVQNPVPNVDLGGLESLPEYVGPSGAKPQQVTVPTKNDSPNDGR